MLSFAFGGLAVEFVHERVNARRVGRVGARCIQRERAMPAPDFCDRLGMLQRMHKTALSRAPRLRERFEVLGHDSRNGGPPRRSQEPGSAVAILLVDIDEITLGTVDEESGAVTLANDADALSYGIVDEIAYRVMRAGGRVLGVRRDDMPGGKPLAAILRYAA